MNRFLSLIILALLLPSAVKAVNVTTEGTQKNLAMAQLSDMKQQVKALEQNPNLQQYQVHHQMHALIDQLTVLSTAANNRGHTKVYNAYERFLTQVRDTLNGSRADRANAARRRLF